MDLQQAGLFALDPGVTYLNHGGFGAVPRPVRQAQDAWRARLDAAPQPFILDELPAALDDARARVAGFVGGPAEWLAFLDNATSAVNAVLGSLALKPGSAILVTSQTYPAVRLAAAWHGARRGHRVLDIEVPAPVADPAEIIAAIAPHLTEGVGLAIFDHIASESAMIWPVAELCRLARAAGAVSLVDGAHAPGQLALDLPGLGCDLYAGNLHKWAFAPTGCGFLWARPALQEGLWPPVISWGASGDFSARFAWQGTREMSAFLAAPDGLDVHDALGGPALMAANRALARKAALAVADIWGTDAAGPDAHYGAMVPVRLPFGQHRAEADELRNALWHQHRIVSALVEWDGALWARLSSQAYNRIEDYTRFAQALLALKP